MKKRFIIENQFLIGDVNNGLFQVLDNEASISYGLTNFIAIGIFDDYFSSNHEVYGREYECKKHLFGPRVTISVMPLLKSLTNNNFFKKTDLNVNGYCSYSTGRSFPKISDKKDFQDWPVYFRIGGKYYFNRHFYMAASIGVYNTDRFFLGVGIKL
ncbi:MAG: hypothetical protein RBS73_05985 [Prolixibacteraceae bacterium]|nr:hypothetical protein [Prolixibacteraceae bacterium]